MRPNRAIQWLHKCRERTGKKICSATGRTGDKPKLDSDANRIDRVSNAEDTLALEVIQRLDRPIAGRVFDKGAGFSVEANLLVLVSEN